MGLPGTPPGAVCRCILCEQADLASGTSSAATKLIHGGLRYLEYLEFRLVREALAEREVLWRIAPHIIWPLRFVLPYHEASEAGVAPSSWTCSSTTTSADASFCRRQRLSNLAKNLAGRPLKPGRYSLGFEYSDCWVDDARLVVLNARDAADRGARLCAAHQGGRAERVGGLGI